MALIQDTDADRVQELERQLARKDSLLELLQYIAVRTNEASSLKEALQHALDGICKFSGWPVGHAYLQSAESEDVLQSSGVFHFEDPSRFDQFRKATENTRLKKGSGLPGEVFAYQRPKWIPDVNLDPNFPRAALGEDIGVVSGFAFPLLVGDRSVGVLEFFCAQMAEPDPDLQQVVINIGAQLGRVVEREIAADKIRSSEERLRALTAAALEAIITSDTEGIIRAWDGSATRIFGFDAEEVIGQSVEIVMPSRHIEAHRAGMTRYLETHENRLIGRTVVIEGRRKDGSEVPIELSLSTWTVAGRRYFTAIIRDISARAQSEEQLRASEERFRRLFHHSAVGQAVLSPDGSVRDVNGALCTMLGYPREELLQKGVQEITHPEDSEKDRELLSQVIEGQLSGYQMEKRYLHKDGSIRWGLLNVIPVAPGGHIEFILGQVVDITDRKDAEVQLERRNQELQDFAYVASHDLQEPLRKIRAFSELLEQDFAGSMHEDARDYLSRIVNAASRMSALITDLLSFSRVNTRGEAFRVIDLNEVIRGVLSDLEVAITESGAELDIGDLPQVKADPMQMRQLFQNLIGNALKFRREGVRPEISVYGRLLEPQFTSLMGVQPVCRIEVSDNGIGFEPKYLERIFTPFQRLHDKSQYAGTGMGLAICRRIVERHHGHITAVSEPGEGSTFIVQLPAYHSVTV